MELPCVAGRDLPKDRLQWELIDERLFGELSANFKWGLSPTEEAADCQYLFSYFHLTSGE